jgi:hypothetical protein
VTATLDARPTDTALAHPNRRRAERLKPAYGTVCALHRRPQLRGVGLVWDLSRTGVSMFVAHPPAVGDRVRAELSTEDGGQEPLAVTLRVVWVRPAPTGDYALGAEFARPLTDAELEPFVTPRAVAPAW